MCMELQPHFSKEDFLQPRREWNGPRASTASHGFQTGIHCALLHSPAISQLLSKWGLYIESGVRYIIAFDTKKKKTHDRFMSTGTHAIRLSLCSEVCQFFMHHHMLMSARSKHTKDDKKHKSEAKTGGGIQ